MSMISVWDLGAITDLRKVDDSDVDLRVFSLRCSIDTSDYVPQQVGDCVGGSVPDGYVPRDAVAAVLPDVAERMLDSGLPLLRSTTLARIATERVLSDIRENANAYAAFVRSNAVVFKVLLDDPIAVAYDLR